MDDEEVLALAAVVWECPVCPKKKVNLKHRLILGVNMAKTWVNVWQTQGTDMANA